MVLFIVGCGAPNVPSQEDIEAQVNKELEKAGIDPVDVEEIADNTDDSKSAGEAIELSGDTEDVGEEVVTAGSIWPKVQAFAQEQHKGAVLIGFNNHGTTFSNKYLISKDKYTDGKSNFWVYFFAKDQAAINDEVIDEVSEAFGVVFSEGELSYAAVEIYPEEISAKEITDAKWFGADTDVMVKRAKDAIAKDYDVTSFITIDFDCIPTWPITFATGQGECDMTFYDTENTGFSVIVTPTTGQVNSVESVKFEELF